MNRPRCWFCDRGRIPMSQRDPRIAPGDPLTYCARYAYQVHTLTEGEVTALKEALKEQEAKRANVVLDEERLALALPYRCDCGWAGPGRELDADPDHGPHLLCPQCCNPNVVLDTIARGVDPAAQGKAKAM